MRYALIPLAMISCASPMAPSAKLDSVCPVQSLACFDSKADVIVGNNTYSAHVTSEDMPASGYANRWRYLILDLALPPQSVDEVTVCGEAVIWPDGFGGMYMQGVGYWRLNLHPVDPSIALQFAALAGAHECRTQNFVTRPYGSGTEILIEEPS